MFRGGYRTIGEGHHAAVIRFLDIALGPEYSDVLILMERMRRQRNRATYVVAGIITLRQAKEAVDTATGFVAEIKHRLTPEG